MPNPPESIFILSSPAEMHCFPSLLTRATGSPANPKLCRSVQSAKTGQPPFNPVCFYRNCFPSYFLAVSTTGPRMLRSSISNQTKSCARRYGWIGQSRRPSLIPVKASYYTPCASALKLCQMKHVYFLCSNLRSAFWVSSNLHQLFSCCSWTAAQTLCWWV